MELLRAGHGHQQMVDIPLKPSFIADDPRLRVEIVFTAQHNHVVFPLLLDTGSNSVHVEEALTGLPPAAHARYWDSGLGVRRSVPLRLHYGVNDHLFAVHETKQVQEMARASSRNGMAGFYFPLRLGLTTPVGEMYLGAGLLGAGPLSDFAVAARTFAFAPGHLKSSLLIGNRDWRRLCRGGVRPKFFPLSTQATTWLVPGTVAIGQYEARANWLIDTGASVISLPMDAYMHLLSELTRRGSFVQTAPPGDPTQVRHCQNYRVRFPTIRLVLRNGRGGYMAVRLRPTQYVTQVAAGETFCQLSLVHFGPSQGGGEWALFGMPLLKYLVTVFSQETRSVGFCPVSSIAHIP